jgi:hypothetical protein
MRRLARSARSGSRTARSSKYPDRSFTSTRSIPRNRKSRLWIGAGKAGYGLAVTSVRYSYAELLTFYERLAGEDLPGDACVSYGFDAETNALVFTLRRLDDEVVSHVHERVPSDAVRITVEPRAPHGVAM